MNDKQSVAIHAANLVEDGMLVGLGTGSTANYFIEALARRKQEEQLQFSTVSSSVVSMMKAQQLGLDLVAIEHIRQLDLYVDGADEVSPEMSLLKGRGFDLVKEKLLAKASEQFYVLIDNSKLVIRIGEVFPIPVEVTPFSWQMVLRSLQQIGGEGELRKNTAGDGLAITSHGSLVLDMTFDSSLEAVELNMELNAIPGVVEHGIFYQLATHVFMAKDGVVVER
ncbi:MAG: ribose-5-phosphate isomerase RpiA [Gammaproteobacteria bacterium]|nr:ribose-5-phosphate isomerase RpiA [Gammaproteobacteria bacterium]